VQERAIALGASCTIGGRTALGRRYQVTWWPLHIGIIGIRRFDTEWRRRGVYPRCRPKPTTRAPNARGHDAVMTGSRERPLVNGQLPEEPTKPHRFQRADVRPPKRATSHPTSTPSPRGQRHAPRPSVPTVCRSVPSLHSTTVTAWALRHEADPRTVHHRRAATHPTHEEQGRESPYSRVLSDTSREVRYLSTRSAR
jgi:hypothetical protein